MASFTRFLAAVAATFFVVAPVAIVVAFVDGEDATWKTAAVLAAMECGAALLAVGVVRWYGRTALLLRVFGTILAFLAGIASVSFAFIYMPVALLAVPSFRVIEPRGETPTWQQTSRTTSTSSREPA